MSRVDCDDPGNIGTADDFENLTTLGMERGTYSYSPIRRRTAVPSGVRYRRAYACRPRGDTRGMLCIGAERAARFVGANSDQSDRIDVWNSLLGPENSVFGRSKFRVLWRAIEGALPETSKNSVAWLAQSGFRPSFSSKVFWNREFGGFGTLLRGAQTTAPNQCLGPRSSNRGDCSRAIFARRTRAKEVFGWNRMEELGFPGREGEIRTIGPVKIG